MVKIFKPIALVLLVLLNFFCTKTKDDVTQPEEPGAEKLDVNIVSTSYILNTISSDHLDTLLNSGSYYNSITLTIKLDQPEKRNQINKIIIYDKNNLGWEFFGSELNNFYVDSVGGYIIKNLIYYSTSYGSSSSYTDIFWTIKTYAKDNSTNNQYDCVIKNGFWPSFQTTNRWVNHTDLRIYFSYYYGTLLPKYGKIIWLDRKKQKLNECDLQLQNLSDQYSTSIGTSVKNVPDSVLYYYLEFSEMLGTIQRNLKTGITLIDKRFPSNIKIFSESVPINNALYLPDKNKIIFWNSSKISIVNSNTLAVEKSFDQTSNIKDIQYDKVKGICYVGTTEGNIYKLDPVKMNLLYVNNFGNYLYGFSLGGNFLFASVSSNYLSILNLTNNIITKSNVSNSDYFYEMLYNVKNNRLYCRSSYSLMSYKVSGVDGSMTYSKSGIISSNGASELYLFPDSSNFIAQTGEIYGCSESEILDLDHKGKIYKPFNSIAFSDDKNYFVTLTTSDYSSDPKVLGVFSASDYQVEGVLNKFYGAPASIAFINNKICIFSITSNNLTVAEEYSIEDILYGIKLTKRNSFALKCYFPKKVK